MPENAAAEGGFGRDAPSRSDDNDRGGAREKAETKEKEESFDRAMDNAERPDRAAPTSTETNTVADDDDESAVDRTDDNNTQNYSFDDVRSIFSEDPGLTADQSRALADGAAVMDGYAGLTTDVPTTADLALQQMNARYAGQPMANMPPPTAADRITAQRDLDLFGNPPTFDDASQVQVADSRTFSVVEGLLAAPIVGGALLGNEHAQKAVVNGLEVKIDAGVDTKFGSVGITHTDKPYGPSTGGVNVSGGYGPFKANAKIDEKGLSGNTGVGGGPISVTVDDQGRTRVDARGPGIGGSIQEGDLTVTTGGRVPVSTHAGITIKESTTYNADGTTTETVTLGGDVGKKDAVSLRGSISITPGIGIPEAPGVERDVYGDRFTNPHSDNFNRSLEDAEDETVVTYDGAMSRDRVPDLPSPEPMGPYRNTEQRQADRLERLDEVRRENEALELERRRSNAAP